MARHLSTYAIAIVTAVCMGFTIFFTYNSSLETPPATYLVAKSPERTILILNVMSQITLFALAELTTLTMDATKWALACSTSGTSALTFLMLSKATSFLGAMVLACRNGKPGTKVERNKHRIWGAQRILLTLLRVLLGVVLLSEVTFRATYHQEEEFPVIQSGLDSMNTSFVDDPFFQYLGTGNFWWNFASIMSYSLPIEPLHCSGKFCKSFFFPGMLSLAIFPSDAPPIDDSDSPSATTIMQKNAPGYQFEFYPIDENQDPPMTLDDCQVFGIPIVALQLCLKKTNESSLIAAWNPCPIDVAEETSCLNDTEWQLVAPINTKMTISKRYASAIFDRANLTLIDVKDLSPPIPMVYEPEDLFAIYEALLSVNLTSPDWDQSTPFSLLFTVITFLQNKINPQIRSTGTLPQIQLEQFLATPIVIFCDAWLGRLVSDLDMGKSLVLTASSYRLLISPLTLYMFMIGGLVSLLWCLIVLSVSLARRPLPPSFFPEIDFASKIVSESKFPSHTSSLWHVLSNLRMANSFEITKELAKTKFYMRNHQIDSDISLPSASGVV